MSFFEGKVAEVSYLNHHNIWEIRRIVPRYIWHGVSKWHGPKAKWFMRVVCLERQAERDFDMANIQDWEVADDQSLPWRS